MTKTILVIEDDNFTNTLYKHIFAKRDDYELVLTDDFDEIIKTLDSIEIHAVILDVSLRNTIYNGDNVDGIFISKFLKANENYANIPILLVTAHQVYGNKDKYIDESKANDYITKPLRDLNIVVNKMDQLTSTLDG